MFGDPITLGLLVFQIEDQNITLPCATKINILCADGKWTWKLLTGASTPYDRSDDLIGRDQPTRFANYDERHFITIAVPPTTYSDYVCLDHHPLYPGSKYNRNDFLGDFADFFGVGYNDVLTKYSNPGTYIIGGTAKDVGFEITGYNATTKEYTLSLQVTAAGVTSLKPSKPQNLNIAWYNNHPKLTWESNLESDVVTGGSYKIYRAINDNGAISPYSLVATVSHVTGATQQWIDGQIYPSGKFDPVLTYLYKVTAFDTQAKESVASDLKTITGYGVNWKAVYDENKVLIETDYNLSTAYPNPFNPSTIINYSIKEIGIVKLKVFDILGSEVAELVNEVKEAGNHLVEFNASSLPSGVYIYSMQINGFSSTKKMLLMK